MTHFKENLSVKSIITPNQIETIHDHRWYENHISAAYQTDPEYLTLAIGLEIELDLNKSDAIAIANHFNLLPKPIQLGNVREYLNGELVETVTNDDFKIGGFMTEDRNDD